MSGETHLVAKFVAIQCYCSLESVGRQNSWQPNCKSTAAIGYQPRGLKLRCCFHKEVQKSKGKINSLSFYFLSQKVSRTQISALLKTLFFPCILQPVYYYLQTADSNPSFLPEGIYLCISLQRVLFLSHLTWQLTISERLPFHWETGECDI